MYTACVLGFVHYREQSNNVASLYVYWLGEKKTRQTRNVYELLMSVKCMLSLSESFASLFISSCCFLPLFAIVF